MVSWPEHILDSDFPAQSTIHFLPIVKIWKHIWLGHNGIHSDFEDGNIDIHDCYVGHCHYGDCDNGDYTASST